MTIRELYKWAEENNALDKELVTYDNDNLCKIDDVIDSDNDVELISNLF